MIIIPGNEMKIKIHFIKAKKECKIAKAFENPNGSINMDKIKIFSIPSQIAAVIPKKEIKIPVLLAKDDFSYVLAINNDALKRTNP